MNQGLVAVLVLAGCFSLLLSAFVIRDGLIAVASLPDEWSIRELTIRHGVVQGTDTSGDAAPPGMRMTIENMRVESVPGAVVERAD